MEYFTLDYAIKLHDAVIEESGGLRGERDTGQLDSVLHHIQNDDYYPTFIDKLTHLIYSTVKFHMFLDGNKRTSILLAVHFMNLNQYSYAVEEFIVTMEGVVVQIAENNMDKEHLKEQLIALMN
ncbi:type II toxin-antitoxin system death-on-curing family toxin [Dolosicoccus paucivorans]|uniref:type II toxin-antitoxin system death-on-curing family toxin n=1 Tax=Dolosicoccus paucivorans TaxID=84521 RepID=UPI00088E9374|nr:type II toxin-antitoxin system death-on-curing family toxin [Dolosicoccus paucivorans]SDI40203.1 death on curing protein [Dolosicoccus paucivorans]